MKNISSEINKQYKTRVENKFEHNGNMQAIEIKRDNG